MSRQDKHWIRPFVNGAIASVAAETATFPLDLAKTRLQIQVRKNYTKSCVSVNAIVKCMCFWYINDQCKVAHFLGFTP